MHDPTPASAAVRPTEVILDEIPPQTIRFKAVEWNGTTYDHLVMREPTVADLLEARKTADPFDQALILIQRVSGSSPQLLYKLPQRVLERAAEYFAPFTPPSPESAGAS